MGVVRRRSGQARGWKPCAWLPKGERYLSGFARRSARPEAARAGAYAGGYRRVFWLPILGRARCASRRAARPGAAADACAGVARRTLARCCHLVAVVLLASYCRRSRLSTNGASSSSPGNSSQVCVSLFRRPCPAGRAPNNFLGRAKFELVLLNASLLGSALERSAAPLSHSAVA